MVGVELEVRARNEVAGPEARPRCGRAVAEGGARAARGVVERVGVGVGAEAGHYC